MKKPWLTFKLKYKILASQIVWAVSQAALVFMLASLGDLDLIGLIMLGFGVYAPIALLLGFNLRNRVAVDVGKDFSKKNIVILRLITSLISLVFSAIIILIYSNVLNAAIAATLIISLRVSDQVADAAAGFYQRDNEFDKIAKSLLLRAFAQITPFLACYFFGLEIIIAAAIAFFLSIMVVFIFDLGDIYKEKKSSCYTGYRELILFKGKNKVFLLFPFMDSIYANLLRYSAAIFLTTESVGRIGLAQTLYSPLAILITTIGYSHLSSTVKAISDKSWIKAYSLLVYASAFGLMAVLTSVVILYFMPLYFYELIGLVPAEIGKVISIFIFIAFAPLVVNGFACQTLLASGKISSYSLNPCLGILCYVCLFVFLTKTLDIGYLNAGFFAFFFSSLVRAILSFCSVINLKKEYRL